jgi:excisionase family DNA binding protein
MARLDTQAPGQRYGLPPLLRTKEVARLFGVSPRTVWRWVKRGLLPAPARLRGKIVRWPTRDILSYLQVWREINEA